jgi:hypothetical protein
MIKKIKTLILSLALLTSFSAPVLIAAPALAVNQDQINGALCQGANINVDTGTDIDKSSGAKQCVNQSDTPSLTAIIKKVITILSLLVGAISVVMIIIGGFRYVTSAGSDKGVESAKKTIMYALIGLVIVALAQVIVHFVLNNIT